MPFKINFGFCSVSTISTIKDLIAVNGSVHIQRVFNGVFSMASFVVALERLDHAMMNCLMHFKVNSSTTSIVASLESAFKPLQTVNLSMAVQILSRECDVIAVLTLDFG